MTWALVKCVSGYSTLSRLETGTLRPSISRCSPDFLREATLGDARARRVVSRRGRRHSTRAGGGSRGEYPEGGDRDCGGDGDGDGDTHEAASVRGGAPGGILNVLRADAHADEAAEDVLDTWNADDDLELPRGMQRAGVAEEMLKTVVSVDLKALGDAGGEVAALLNAGEESVGDAMFAQRAAEEIGRGDRILNSEIDADSASGRHGVRGVSDAEQPGAMPMLQTIDLD